jgi:hypothetical protein
MLIPFTSKAAADFFMLQTHAAPLFALMGKPLTAQGVIAASETAKCLAKLQTGLASAELNTPVDDVDPDAVATELLVSLKQRAWPLLDMLERANKKQADVLWGVNR